MARALAACAALLLVAAVARAAPDLAAQDARSGSLRQRLAHPDGADLVVLYGDGQGGDEGTCGCEVRPLGSLARVEGYRRAVARGPVPEVLVNAGGFLDATPDVSGGVRADAALRDARMIEALRLGHWDAWNVGAPDLPWLAAHGFPPEAVSANLRPIDPSKPAPQAFRVVQAGRWKVGITGVSGTVPDSMTGWRAADPVAAVRALLPALRAKADVVVVLAWHPAKAVLDLARIPGIAVIVESTGAPGRWPPDTEGQGVWVRSDPQTHHLGELRLHLAGGRVTSALDRQIDLDARIPSDARLARHAAVTDARVAALQRADFGKR